jgi:hypothetical protein
MAIAPDDVTDPFEAEATCSKEAARRFALYRCGKTELRRDEDDSGLGDYWLVFRTLTT